jgi:hypothetical protein
MSSKDPRTTTQRGLGWRHQQQRKALLASLVPGTRCPRCGEPMWPRVQDLDVDHVVPRSQGGAGGPVRLAHARCNRAHGAELARQAIASVSERPECQRTKGEIDAEAAQGRALACICGRGSSRCW